MVDSFFNILKTLKATSPERSSIYSLFAEAITFNPKTMEPMTEDLLKGSACICDISVIGDPFLLRLAILCHKKIYAIESPYDLFNYFRAGVRLGGLLKKNKIRGERLVSELKRERERMPWIVEAFSDGTLVPLEQIEWLAYVDLILFFGTLRHYEVDRSEYLDICDKEISPPAIDYKAIRRLTKKKTTFHLSLERSADPTYKLFRLLKRHNLFEKTGMNPDFDELPTTASARALLMHYILPLEAGGYIGSSNRMDKLRVGKPLPFEKRQGEMFDMLSFASFISCQKSPSMTANEGLYRLLRQTGAQCHLVSDIGMPDLRQTIMEMSFKDLSTPSGNLSLLPKLLSAINAAAKGAQTLRLLTESVKRIVAESQEELTNEFGLGRERLVFRGLDLGNIDYPVFESDYSFLIPSYVIKEIRELRSESEKTRTVLKKQHRTIMKKLGMRARHDKTLGTKVWNQIESFFNVESSDLQKTAFFKDMAHSDLLKLLLKWIETRNRKARVFGQIIHGPKESGIDIIAQISEYNEKFGIQLKNNDDVKAKDFTTKIKAQVTDSRKHELRGLVVVFAADLTDNSIEGKVRGIVSEFSQMKDALIKVVPPQKAFTIINEITS